jgi:hypothetical protein
MRMADKHSPQWFLVFGFLENGFQLAGRAVQHLAFDTARHQFER